jgi:hypothetical protein
MALQRTAIAKSSCRNFHERRQVEASDFLIAALIHGSK